MKHLKNFNELYESTVYVAAQQIPYGIQKWAEDMSGSKLKEYQIDQSGNKVTISQPWHIGCQEIYQFFDLASGHPVGNTITRSGSESDSPQGYEEGRRKSGTLDIPEGKVLLRYSSYPKSVVRIYTSVGAQMFLADKSKGDDLTDEEMIILKAAVSLKPFARPKFADNFYDNLINKNLLNKNRSVTIDGKNLVRDKDFQEKCIQAVEKYKQKTHNYLSFNWY